MHPLPPHPAGLLTVRHADDPPAWVHATLAGLRALGWRLTRQDVSRDSHRRAVIWLHAHEPPATFENVLRPVFDGYALPNPWAALSAAAQGHGHARLAIARRDSGAWHDVAGMQAFVDTARPDRGLIDALPKLHHLFDAALRNPQPGPPITVRAPDGPARRARDHARVVARWAKDKVQRRGTQDQWQLGFRFGGTLADASGYTWVQPPTDRFWADPFPFERDGQHFVFYEEFCYPHGPGTLHVASVSPDDGFRPLGPVLDTGSHLSFPNVFRVGEDLFMLPESVATGEVRLYRCTSFPHQWELHHVLAKRRLVDCVLVYHDGVFWLMGSEDTVGAMSSCDNLVALRSDSLLGPYEAVSTPLVLDVRSARHAGAWIRDGDQWIRTAQDCSGRYGRAVHIRRVTRLDAHGLKELSLASHEPQPGELGRHTLNRSGDLFVTDRQVRVRVG